MKRLSDKAISTLQKLARVGAEEQLCKKIENEESIWKGIEAALRKLFKV